MQSLPITHVIPQIKETLHSQNRLVLQAPPGAGKTTALPLALLDEPWLEGRKIIMLEPRRLAVRTSASRMAALLGEKVGQRVGYQIRMESVQSDATQILIVTEGILTRKLQQDPALEDTALIIFDEFHERSLHADLSLALSLESQSLLREDLKIMVMSATLNTSAICALLDNAPVIQSQGRAFPVERIYLPRNTPQPSKKELPGFVHQLLLRLLKEEEGNMLVFLPGIGEIKAVERLLHASVPEKTYISPLYGNLSKEAQERAIEAPPKGYRKIVLSTNIAQTSLTIEGISTVVDSGLQNVSVFNPFTGMNRLESRFICEDAATQRAGRAGRLSAGKAYHLWPKARMLEKHDTPEILLADLSPMLLELALWGTDDIHTLSWMDTPPDAALSHARVLLVQLGALDERGYITKHGRAMSRFGLHPRLSHMMLRAKAMDLAYEASLLAVLMTEKDIFTQGNRDADLRERVAILHDIAKGKEVASKEVDIRQCRYLLKLVRRIEPRQPALLDTTHLGTLLAYAYPDRIARERTDKPGSYLLSNGKGALLHPQESLFHTPFLVISDLDARKQEARIYKALSLTQEELERFHADLIESSEEAKWNEAEERVEVRRVTRLGAVVLEESQASKAESEAVVKILIEALETMDLERLQWSKEALSLRARVNFLNHHGLNLPDLSDAWLKSHMQEWLAPYLEGITTLKAVQTLDFHPILLGLLSYEQIQLLESLAPVRIKVASGSDIAIDYSDPSQPLLAVRLQEMFGTRETPAVLNGKVKLMLHLLSPASRPMQVTKDLESFWKNTYDEVKKELRGKYKKHYWPDDPLEAQATSRTKKYM